MDTNILPPSSMSMAASLKTSTYDVFTGRSRCPEKNHIRPATKASNNHNHSHNKKKDRYNTIRENTIQYSNDSRSVWMQSAQLPSLVRRAMHHVTLFLWVRPYLLIFHTPWKINGWNLQITQFEEGNHLPNLHFGDNPNSSLGLVSPLAVAKSKHL